MNEIEQALHCMKQQAEIEVCEECINYDTCDHTKQKEMAQIAIEALEKQIPKKVEDWNSQASCPNCKILFFPISDINYVANKPLFCKDCGQKLDWCVEE